MRYYQVLVRDRGLRAADNLTYQFDGDLEIGRIVKITLKNRQKLGVVWAKAVKPSFTTKPIELPEIELRLPLKLLELQAWLTNYYPAAIGAINSLLLPNDLPSSAIKNQTEKHIKSQASALKLPDLTKDQSAALKQILINQVGTLLLHGETASGKTRVYIELIVKSLAQGRSVIVLTPEIGLTSQLETILLDSFPDQVIVLHSTLTTLVRASRWLKIVSSHQPLIIIGPRSALFAPIHKLGLIVIDEAHDTAYKQNQAPYYLATRVAAKLADLHSCLVVFGSATPLVADYFTLKTLNRPIVRMIEPAISSSSHSKKVTIVDLKDKSLFSRSEYLSDQLLESITASFKNHNQTLLLLNRRGSAKVVMCQLCGWRATCSKCSSGMTYHADLHILQCHNCGNKINVPSQCPNCHNPQILYKVIGTKFLAEHLQKLFPKSVVGRFDSDNLQADKLVEQYSAVRAGKFDIIVGTQTISKGLDLPLLTTLGIVYADTGLVFPDYLAEERSYQLLYQTLGRINRGHIPGEAFIQSFSPESALIKAAIASDYSTFYTEQLSQRKQYYYPPYCYLLKLVCARKRQESSRLAAEKYAEDLKSIYSGSLIIDGPFPAFKNMLNGYYRWQINIKSPRRTSLVQVVKNLPSGWQYDLDPIDLL